MSNNENKVHSLGEKMKKFKMPKFPAAAIILFGVLLFMVFLSWIPHKGWVDTYSPLFYFTEEGLYGGAGTLLATWTTKSLDSILTGNIEDATLGLIFTTNGAAWLDGFLVNFVTQDQATKIADSAGKTGISISNINLGDDWNLVGINYSGLTFTIKLDTALSTADATGELQSSYYVEFDKVFNPTTLAMTSDDGVSTGFTSNVLSLSVAKDASMKDSFIDIASIAIGPDWFNFWESNYYVAGSNGRYGLLDIPFVILAGMFKATGIVFFLLCIGAFIEVMMESGALEAGTSSLINKFKGKEMLLIPVLFIIFNLGGTTYGMAEETLGLIPLIVPFLVLAGFDTMTGFLVVLIGTETGVAAGVTDPFSIGIMSQMLSVPAAEEAGIQVGIQTGISFRIIMWFVLCIMGMTFVLAYAHRAKKGKDYVREPEMFEKNQEWAHQRLGEAHAANAPLTRKQAIGLSIFVATFFLMVFSLLPWPNWFPGLETSGFWNGISSIFFGKLLFGQWYFVQLALLFLIASLILGRVLGLNQKQTNKSVFNGAKSMLGVAKILVLARAIALVFTYSGLVGAMVALVIGGSSSAGAGGAAPFVVAWTLVPIFAIFVSFVPSTSGVAGIIGPIVGPIVWGLGGVADFEHYVTIVLMTHVLIGSCICMFNPTTGLIVAQAEAAKINFGKALPILVPCALTMFILGEIVINCSIMVMFS